MENYNDFNLPNDSNIKLMQEMYKSDTFNRRTSLTNISSLAHSFLSQCYGIENKLNLRIRSRLEETKKELEKLIENLSLTFSFTYSVSNQSITNFNLFYSLKILIQIVYELHELETNEEKAYFKKFTKNTISSILNHLNNILEALGNSYVHVFKYI